MDHLDLMFRRLVQNIRNSHPQYLAQPFEVSEVYQTLIPYRHNRRELQIDTNQDYEIALCQLLSGERGYLVSDESMAEAMRSELSTSNPNTAIFREFAASRVTLAPNAVRRWEELGGDLGPLPTLATPATPAVPPLPPPPWAGRSSTAATATAAPPAADRGATPAPRPSSAGTPAATNDGSCRYCGGALPSGRAAGFCPHCGQNLKVQRYPACGSELELNWKYCITCGRGVGASEGGGSA